MGTELLPQRYGRPAYVQIDGGARVYLHARDEAHVRTRRWFERRLLLAHPDTAGDDAPPPSHVQQLVERYGRWKLQEELWYGALGLNPPKRGQEAKPLSRAFKQRDLRGAVDPEANPEAEIRAVAALAVERGLGFQEAIQQFRVALTTAARQIAGSNSGAARRLRMPRSTFMLHSRRGVGKPSRAGQPTVTV